MKWEYWILYICLNTISVLYLGIFELSVINSSFLSLSYYMFNEQTTYSQLGTNTFIFISLEISLFPLLHQIGTKAVWIYINHLYQAIQKLHWVVSELMSNIPIYFKHYSLGIMASIWAYFCTGQSKQMFRAKIRWFLNFVLSSSFLQMSKWRASEIHDTAITKKIQKCYRLWCCQGFFWIWRNYLVVFISVWKINKW